MHGQKCWDCLACQGWMSLDYPVIGFREWVQLPIGSLITVKIVVQYALRHATLWVKFSYVIKKEASMVKSVGTSICTHILILILILTNTFRWWSMCAMTMKLELGSSKKQLIHVPQHSGNFHFGWSISSKFLIQMMSIQRGKWMVQMEASK